MSPDNAAEVVVIEPPATDVFATMTDRELLEYNARTLASILTIAEGIREQVEPVMASISKHPMLKMLFK